MLYTTLTYAGVEKSLADWGISTWSRTVQNQGNDDFTFTVPTPMDGVDIFPYGAQITIKINRTTTTVNPINPTLPQSGSTSFTGGTQFFWGYCIDNNRIGDPGSESFNYKFVGPYQFFFERLIFQKLQLTWNGTKQIADYQSDVILGMSLTTLTGTGDTVQGTTATNLMSIAQQLKEICMYAQADSAYQQATNGLAWPGTNQFQCDALTTAVDGINWDLLQTPSANLLIKDFFGTPLSGKTSASTLPAGSYMLRCPLDAVNAITCKEAMQRQLQWLGGIGSPVVWTDHSQTPPQLHIATRDQLTTKSLALSGITVKNKIKKRSNLIPAAVHFKYKVAGTYLGQPYSVIINDVAAYIGGVLVEGIGQLDALVNPLTGAALASGVQTALMAAAKTAASIVQTFDFQGGNVSGQTATVTTVATDFADPVGGGSPAAFWKSILPHLSSVSNLRFFDAIHCPVTFTDPQTGETVDVSALSYHLADGQLASWMTSSGQITAQKVRVTGYFCFTENIPGSNSVPGATVGNKEETITITLTNATSGTYTSRTESAGEPIPYGLAGYILALEAIPQYEGSIVVQETEISDVCPLGNALNITGGLAEWATMLACVQSVRYSDNGQTEITFGPAKHLGPAQFVARSRSNIGPRWFYLINPVLMNNTGAGGPNVVSPNVAQQSPSPGAKQFTFQNFFTNQLDQLAVIPPALPGGCHIDSGAAANRFGYPTGPQIIVANGPDGTKPGAREYAAGSDAGFQAWDGTNILRFDTNDILDSGGDKPQTIIIQEYPCCWDFGDGQGPVSAFVQLLGGTPYKTSLA